MLFFSYTIYLITITSQTFNWINIWFSFVHDKLACQSVLFPNCSPGSRLTKNKTLLSLFSIGNFISWMFSRLLAIRSSNIRKYEDYSIFQNSCYLVKNISARMSWKCMYVCILLRTLKYEYVYKWAIWIENLDR